MKSPFVFPSITRDRVGHEFDSVLDCDAVPESARLQVAMQVAGVFPVHVPLWQVSAVQALPSLHAAPSLLAGFEHSPVDALQAPARVALIEGRAALGVEADTDTVLVLVCLRAGVASMAHGVPSGLESPGTPAPTSRKHPSPDPSSAGSGNLRLPRVTLWYDPFAAVDTGPNLVHLSGVLVPGAVAPRAERGIWSASPRFRTR
ncbi:MAG: hypothetical protein R3B70_36505 [Polyangiaceae bacterium]